MVKKIPNSGFMRMTSPSLKTKVSFFSFLQVKTMLICCAATESTGSSIRLNSSKQPHDPDCAKPETSKLIQFTRKKLVSANIYNKKKNHKSNMDYETLSNTYFYKILSLNKVNSYPSEHFRNSTAYLKSRFQNLLHI